MKTKQFCFFYFSIYFLIGAAPAAHAGIPAPKRFTEPLQLENMHNQTALSTPGQARNIPPGQGPQSSTGVQRNGFRSMGNCLIAQANPHDIGFSPHYNKEEVSYSSRKPANKTPVPAPRPESIFSEKVTIKKPLGFFEDSADYPRPDGFLDNVEIERMKKRKQQLQ